MNRTAIRNRVWSVAALLSALATVAVFPGAVAAATHPITFELYMGENCIEGRASDDATVQLLWKDVDGTRKARTSVVASPLGYWTFCSSRVGVEVETGDRISANDGTSTHLLVVPELTLFQNRITDQYRGRGPAGQIVRLICGLTNGFEPCQQVWRIRVNAQGQWSLGIGHDVVGMENMGLRWKSPAGDKVNVWNTAPFVVVTIGQAAISGAARSEAAVTVVLMKANTVDIRGTAHATGDLGSGLFRSRFLNQNGNRARVQVGDRVTSDIAADLDWIVTDIDALGDVSTSHVTGHCVQALQFTVSLFRDGDQIAGDRWFTEEDGSFDSDFENEPLASGDWLLVGCQLSTGDWIQKWFAVA